MQIHLQLLYLNLYVFLWQIHFVFGQIEPLTPLHGPSWTSWRSPAHTLRPHPENELFQLFGTLQTVWQLSSRVLLFPLTGIIHHFIIKCFQLKINIHTHTHTHCQQVGLQSSSSCSWCTSRKEITSSAHAQIPSGRLLPHTVVCVCVCVSVCVCVCVCLRCVYADLYSHWFFKISFFFSSSAVSLLFFILLSTFTVGLM